MTDRPTTKDLIEAARERYIQHYPDKIRNLLYALADRLEEEHRSKTHGIVQSKVIKHLRSRLEEVEDARARLLLEAAERGVQQVRSVLEADSRDHAFRRGFESGFFTGQKADPTGPLTERIVDAATEAWKPPEPSDPEPEDDPWQRIEDMRKDAPTQQNKDALDALLDLRKRVETIRAMRRARLGRIKLIESRLTTLESHDNEKTTILLKTAAERLKDRSVRLDRIETALKDQKQDITTLWNAVFP